MISINDLERMFQQGHFKDFNLVEYDFIKYFIEETTPKDICVIGGSTNIDLFYGCQGQNINIINFDRPHESTMQSLFQKQKHAEYRTTFSFQGNYTWINRIINNLDQLENWQEFLMVGAQIDILYEMMKSQKFPNSMIVFHAGDLFHAQAINEIANDIPLFAMSKRLAFFTFKNIPIDKKKFMITQKNFFQHGGVNRLVT